MKSDLPLFFFPFSSFSSSSSSMIPFNSEREAKGDERDREREAKRWGERGGREWG